MTQTHNILHIVYKNREQQSAAPCHVLTLRHARDRGSPPTI